VIILFAAIGLFFSTANAGSLKGGYPACMTEELYNQILSAIVKENDREFQYLLKTGCVMTKAGLKVTVLERNWDGMSRVRIFLGDGAVVVWTSSENVVRE